jgi:hypothetical protein
MSHRVLHESSHQPAMRRPGGIDQVVERTDGSAAIWARRARSHGPTSSAGLTHRLAAFVRPDWPDRSPLAIAIRRRRHSRTSRIVAEHRQGVGASISVMPRRVLAVVARTKPCPRCCRTLDRCVAPAIMPRPLARSVGRQRSASGRARWPPRPRSSSRIQRPTSRIFRCGI